MLNFHIYSILSYSEVTTPRRRKGEKMKIGSRVEAKGIADEWGKKRGRWRVKYVKEGKKDGRQVWFERLEMR